MSAEDLGPLPEPDHWMRNGYASFEPHRDAVMCFTADQLEAERQRCYELGVMRERKRCARIVETQDTYGDPIRGWLEVLAAKIRACPGNLASYTIP